MLTAHTHGFGCLLLCLKLQYMYCAIPTFVKMGFTRLVSSCAIIIAMLMIQANQWRSQPNSDARTQIFTHNVTTCLDAGPTFMKAQKIMYIQYNLS